MQWQRGFALYYAGRFQEAREHFAANALVDSDDVEPVIWKFVVRQKLTERSRRGRPAPGARGLLSALCFLHGGGLTFDLFVRVCGCAV
jgi:hypothetical protein